MAVNPKPTHRSAPAMAGAALVVALLLVLAALPAPVRRDGEGSAAMHGVAPMAAHAAREERTQAADARASDIAGRTPDVDAALAASVGDDGAMTRTPRPMILPGAVRALASSEGLPAPGGDVAPMAAPSLEKKLLKLEKKLLKNEAKSDAADAKHDAALQLELDGDAALDAAALLPESTPAEQKAKIKATKKAHKMLAKAAKRQAKWTAQLAALAQKHDELLAAIAAVEDEIAEQIVELAGTTLAVDAPHAGALVFTWDEVSGAEGYVLSWAGAPGVDPDAADGSAEVAGSPFVLEQQDAGMFVHAVVQAVAGASRGPASNEVAALILADDGAFDPPWADAQPSDVHTLPYDATLSETENGAALKAKVASLVPGDRLEIGTGTWSVNSFWDVRAAGTEQAPIWIVAATGARPVITRPNASQNVMNVGSGGPTRYLVMRGLEITGGSAGVRFVDCENVWFDRNEVHHVGEAGLTTNQHDTDRLFITRNHLHHTAGYGEGMYLGANNGVVKMSRSVIALNRVHDTTGIQGDGIELKQGSWGNRVASNLVHDTKYPCLLVYGTAGEEPNIVEGNVLMRSSDNTLQVQGEAVVRNNLILGGSVGFHSHDHQDATRDLVFVHNTILTVGKATNLSHWNDREGMVFANNVVYSQTSRSLNFTGGSSGVTVVGNVSVGQVVGASGGYVLGGGLDDFIDAAWDGTQHVAVPVPGAAPVGAGSGAWETDGDLLDAQRTGPVVAGCVGGM